MKILFISKEGDGLGLGCSLSYEENEVYFWIAEQRFHRAGRGMVNRIPSWRSVVKDVDLIICDIVGFSHLSPVFQAAKKPVLSCSSVGDHIELDRRFGMKVANGLGIEIPETWQFDRAGDAKKFPNNIDWKDGLVIKPDGNLSTAKTMVVKDKELWEYSLSQVPSSASMIVQRIVRGIEISTEGWFNGSSFITPFNHTFEEKKFLTGNLGQATGCMGNVVIISESNKLTKATVEKMTPLLKRISYHGPVDINCIVDENAARALEFTMRLGYDAIEALHELYHGDFAEFLLNVAKGTIEVARFSDEIGMAVRLSIPPWPVSKPKAEDYNEPIGGITHDSLAHIYLTDVFKDGKDTYRTAGGDGVILKATSRGRFQSRPEERGGGMDFVREARRRVYRTLERIEISSPQYRVDIGNRVNDELPKLKKWGWL